MIGTVLIDKRNNLPIGKLSGYQPTPQVRELTIKIGKDYDAGMAIMNRPFREFNDVSLLQRMDNDQKVYNSYVEVGSNNPDDAWRWNGVSNLTHNKIISMAGHFVSATLYPGVFAQNDEDEEDKLSAEVMKYLLEYNIRNSDYETSYLYAIVAALVNPVAYLSIDYIEAMQKVKKRHDNGEITTEEAVDEIVSGFQVSNVPAEEIFIADPYQFNIQKQRFLIRRRLINYDSAKTIYGKYENFKYVQPGVKLLFNQKDSMFYEQEEDMAKTNCEEVIYYNRLEDIEVPFVNGIYMGKTNVDANIIRHRDNKNKPKYQYAKFGFQPIGEKRFYFYRSAVMNMADDQKLLDRMRRMTIDGTFMNLWPPIFGMGTGKIDSNVIYPGAFTAVPPNTSITPIKVGNDLVAGIRMMGEVRNELDDSSQSKAMEGQLTTEKKTAYEINRAEVNARRQMSVFGIMIKRFVEDVGNLSIDCIIQNETVGEAEETLGGNIKMNFRTLLLPEQTENGKKITRKIKFKPELIGKAMTKKERLKESYRIKKEEGDNSKVYEVNPDVFQKLKFKIIVGAQNLNPRDEIAEEQKAIRDYQLMRQDPLFDQKEVASDLAEAIKKGESDKYMLKEQTPIVPTIPGQQPQQQAPESRSLAGLLKE